MKICDIIVPIYNAYDCVVELVDSLVKYTNLKENRIILINDKSPDERIGKLLKKYKKEYPNFVILENEKNKGFVGTVNVGMKQSKENDVLLLNSDTVVTKNWIDNIKKCAYSSHKIATVTPLSNNATLASVPIPFKKNELPEGMTIDDIAKVVEECSLLDYPDIPTGHGFCLYIKREVLDKVGFFDEETFGKGYGEENDFCFRCLDIGYRNVLCDNVYIYHKESQSFSKSKLELMETNGKKLEKRYPEYYKDLSDWCVNFPIRNIGNNIGFALRKKERKKNILVLIHDWNNVESHLGGTTLHVYDIISKLRDKYNFHVLAPTYYSYHLTSYWTDSESTISFHRFFDSRKFGFYNNEYKKLLETIVDKYSIDGVHIHHMKNHFFDIVDVIKEHNLYSIVSIHDFYSVCPLINKMYNNKSYCGNPSKETCNKCIEKTFNIHSDMITEWREEWKRLFQTVDKIISPSKSCADEIMMEYKKLKIDIIEHGVELEKREAKYYDDSISRPFNVAFIGAIGLAKGSDIFCDIISSSHKNINIHLFGTIDRILTNNQKRNLIDHGKYKRDELTSLLEENKIDLICLISICPETFSYTLSEAISTGIPVLVSSLGALKERVENNDIGWIVDIDKDNGAKVIIKKIEEIRNNIDDYNNKIDNINKYKVKTTEDMVKDYDKIYEKINVKSNDIDEEYIIDKIHNCNEYSKEIDYADYSWVFSTFKWKLISKLKIPKPIKKVFRRSKDD